MKITSTLTAVVGALAVFTPLTFAAVESEGLAIHDADLEARGVSSCGAASTRKHHNNKKGKKNAKAQAKAKAHHVQTQINSIPKQTQPQQHRHKKVSSARPSHYYSSASQKSTQNASAPKTTPAPSTGSTGSTGGSTGSTGTSSGNLSSFEQTILDIHNQDRAKHSASPLSWSPTLASAAASWAKGCAFKHTPNNPYGQNIAAGTSSTFGATDSANMWYDEISKYNFASGIYSAATGHFTQMVWKGSKQLGCAIQECTASQLGLGSGSSAKYVVCNYDPPGNYIGEFLQNVLPN